uniref:VWFA domain-containing protein n=1 Tax=Panagrolaimus sp. ES5 TaxID=591445 RepID=A0AC34FJ47_9BILA
MNFIKKSIAALNYPSRLRAEGVYGGEFNWNSKLSISQMQSALDAAEDTGNMYSLLPQFSSLVTSFEALNNDSSNFGAIVFISNTFNSESIKNAYRLLPKLKGIRLTFVLFGPNADARPLRNFTSNFLYWQDLSQPQPDNWDLLSYHAYGCDAPFMTSSRKPVPNGPTTTPMPYFPCQNWVEVIIDDSNVLTPAQFQTQLNFIKTFLGQMSHPERIQYGTCDHAEGKILYPWNPNNTQNGLQQAVESTNQTTSDSSILTAFKFITSFRSGILNNTAPNPTIFLFITDTTHPVLIEKALGFYEYSIKDHGIKLTIILAGQRTNAYALNAFDDAIIYNWQNMNSREPDDWDLATAFRCTPPPPTPSKSPYLPCESWIHFGIDDSNNFQHFGSAKDLVSSTIEVSELNFPKRIAVVGIFSQPVFWNSYYSVENIESTVAYFPKGNGPYSLKTQFTTLLANLQYTETGDIPLVAIIFISDTSDEALAGADQIFNQFTKPVKITFVLLGANADESKLTKYSSKFITWSNFSEDQPDNWYNLYYAAFGCQ